VGGPSTVHPDFSASGSSIQFGYALESRCTSPSAASCISQATLDVDNWSVTIESTPVPEPSTALLLGLGLVGLGAKRRQRISCNEDERGGWGKISALCFLAVVLVTTGCSDGVVGGASGKYVSTTNDEEYLELNGDGTFFLQEKGRGATGDYDVEGSVLTLKFGGGMATRANLDDGVITSSVSKTVFAKE